MKSKIYAEIVFKSRRENIDDLAELTGQNPSDQHHIGDTSVTGIKLDYSQWSFGTEIIEAYDTNEIAENLCDLLKGKLSAIVEYIRKHECEVSICIAIHEQGDPWPALGLGQNIIHIASQLNARIDFDGLYRYP